MQGLQHETNFGTHKTNDDDNNDDDDDNLILNNNLHLCVCMYVHQTLNECKQERVREEQKKK